MSRTHVHKPVWVATGHETKNAQKEAFAESPKGHVIRDPIEVDWHELRGNFPRETYFKVEAKRVKGALRTVERTARAKMMVSTDAILEEDFDDTAYLDTFGEYDGYGWWD